MTSSSNKIQIFESLQMGDDDSLSIIMPFDIRWLSNYRANERVLQTFPETIQLLSEYSKKSSTALA